MTTVTIRHMRQATYCRRGTRKFFIKHGLDFSSFVLNGIDEQKLLDTNDAMAKKLVEIANGR